jgi:hypothetical protein
MPETDRKAFVPVGYTSAFDALLDVLRFAADLQESEFRVLLFHVERSLGYGKASDRTSLPEMVEGVYSPKLNSWVRKGCGLGKAAVVRANGALASPDRQLLSTRRRNSPTSGNEATEYEVNWPVLGRYIDERKRGPPMTLVLQQDKPLVSSRDTHYHCNRGEGRGREVAGAAVEHGSIQRPSGYRAAVGDRERKRNKEKTAGGEQGGAR